MFLEKPEIPKVPDIPYSVLSFLTVPHNQNKRINLEQLNEMFLRQIAVFVADINLHLKHPFWLQNSVIFSFFFGR